MPESVYQKEATHIFSIRERNQAETQTATRHKSAVDRTVDALDVFGTKVIAAHLSGVPLNNSIVRHEAREIVLAVLAITREVAH